jgi:hypothetical protein
LIPGGYGERKIFIPQNGKITTKRREPGGRREDEILVKWFVFLAFRKKDLCGLCVLSGSIFFFVPGGYGDFYNFLNNEKIPNSKHQIPNKSQSPKVQYPKQSSRQPVWDFVF